MGFRCRLPGAPRPAVRAVLCYKYRVTQVLVCRVCSEEITAFTEAWCGSCGEVYHLNQRNDVVARDCGKVWISEEHLALEFACDTCLVPAVPAGLEDVLDLVEAAEAARVSEEWLAAEAAAGRVPHRRTAGGVLLFVRKDLPAVQGGHG